MAAANSLLTRRISASPLAVSVSPFPAARGMPKGLELVLTTPELRRVLELRLHVYPDGEEILGSGLTTPPVPCPRLGVQARGSR
jgi:hypothetical protein